MHRCIGPNYTQFSTPAIIILSLLLCVRACVRPSVRPEIITGSHLTPVQKLALLASLSVDITEAVDQKS